MTTPTKTTLEKIFTEVMTLVSEDLTLSEKKEIEEFSDFEEFGIALETLRDIIWEEDKKISEKAFIKIVEMSKVMRMDSKIFYKKLEGNTKK
ncbi:hypothetical protein DYI26_22090 [Halomonas litopenaei]|nr:hypothetical protein [Halomonas litopenaei]